MTAAVKKMGSDNINLRVAPEEKALIDRAAQALGKNRTEYVLDTMRTESENVLLDRRLFKLDEDQYAMFQEMLDGPAEPSEALRKTMSAKAPWTE